MKKNFMRKMGGAPLHKEEASVAMMDDRALHQRISEKAYELYQKRGHLHGQDLEDWLEAERLFLSEQETEAKRDRPGARSAHS